MYSLSNVAVNKVIPADEGLGLGFDFSSIADFVKTAATTSLGVYRQQMQLRQVKALAQAGMRSDIPNPNGIPDSNQYGLYQTQLPLAQMFGRQSNIPQPGMYPQQSSMIDTSTMLMIGGLAVGGILLFKFLKG